MAGVDTVDSSLARCGIPNPGQFTVVLAILIPLVDRVINGRDMARMRKDPTDLRGLTRSVLAPSPPQRSALQGAGAVANWQMRLGWIAPDPGQGFTTMPRGLGGNPVSLVVVVDVHPFTGVIPDISIDVEVGHISAHIEDSIAEVSTEAVVCQMAIGV